MFLIAIFFFILLLLSLNQQHILLYSYSLLIYEFYNILLFLSFYNKLSAVSLASSYGGYSALEKAVHKAYYKKKGIKVYYKIHKSVMSTNKVRYVVG